MHSKVLSAGFSGLETFSVEVEVDVSRGLSNFEIVGLAENAVKEGRARIDSAIRNSGYPQNKNRIRVNLSPATVKKQGSLYDLPIAIGILRSRGVIKNQINGNCMIVGELSLNGNIKPVKGALLVATKAKESGIDKLILPKDNLAEVCELEGLKSYGVSTLDETIRFLNGESEIEYSPKFNNSRIDNEAEVDFSEVKGQEATKRALMVAVAGQHNLLMSGPPGSGKSMMAKRIPSILPKMTYEEKIETTKIYSLLGALSSPGLIRKRPFRSPHHTISDAGMAGGRCNPRPGELSLANNGILFMDEFPEFKKQVLEVMRQPLEDGKVTISRALGTHTFPCNIMLVAAMNPCPCGYLGDPERFCECSGISVDRYFKKLSNPILDRIDIQIEVPRVNFKKLKSQKIGMSSSEMREKINNTHEIQKKRFKKGIFNSKMNEKMLYKYCRLSDECLNLLESAMKKFLMSARAYGKILKVSRTIADLESSSDIKPAHIAEAIHYRSLERRLKL